MIKYSYGRYIIGAEPDKTRRYYAEKPSYMLKCSCPGCQNFFRSAGACETELNEALTLLGIDWRKPENIDLLWADKGLVGYEVSYIARGKRLRSPKLYTAHKNELGCIYVRDPDSFWEINERMKLTFLRGRKGEFEVQLTAVLPWTMETLGRIYEEGERIERPVKGRITRIVEAAVKIKNSLKQGG